MHNVFGVRLGIVAALLCAVLCLFAGPAIAADEFNDYAAEVSRVEDGAKPYLTVFGDVPFDVAELKAMHPGAHFRHIKTKNDPVAARYTATVGEWPAVVYQQPTGEVVFKVSGKNVPRTAHEVASVGGRCRPFRPQPEPAPEPAPIAPVAPPTYDETIPDTVDEPVADEPVWLYVLIGAVSAAVSAGIGWLREIRGEE